MVKIYRGEASLFDLAAIGRTPGVRTAVTPFGMDGIGLKRYIGASVPWKGVKVKGAAGMSESDIEAVLGEHGRLAAGVKKIASVSKEVGTVTGVALGSISGTDYKGRPYTKRGIVPKRCFEIARKHGKTVTIEREAARTPDVIKPVAYPSVVVPIPV